MRDDHPVAEAKRRTTRLAARVGSAAAAALAIPLTATAACLPAGVVNPSFATRRADVRTAWRRMRSDPTGLERPVVILGGYRAPGNLVNALRWRLEMLTGADPDRLLAVSYLCAGEIAPIAERVIRLVEDRWPSEEDAETVEVDVIGISMGGLVGRLAAMPADARRRAWSASASSEPSPGRKRLRVRRLYTLASPHRGARLAEIVAPDPAARAMRPGSAFLRHLDEGLESADYELVPYAVLRDLWVGATRTSPEGTEPIWLGGGLLFSHLVVSDDHRIVVDLACRLRGEEPLSREGSCPPRN